MKDKKEDKRTESQFDDLEGVDWSWTSESQEEMGKHFAEQEKKKKS